MSHLNQVSLEKMIPIIQSEEKITMLFQEIISATSMKYILQQTHRNDGINGHSATTGSNKKSQNNFKRTY